MSVIVLVDSFSCFVILEGSLILLVCSFLLVYDIKFVI